MEPLFEKWLAVCTVLLLTASVPPSLGASFPSTSSMSYTNSMYSKVSQYHRMPKLASYDAYDQCLEEVPSDTEAVYCLVRVVLKPDNRSELWNQIDGFSSDSRLHFNHALLDRGVCLNWCRWKIERLTEGEKTALRVDKFDINFPYIFDTTAFEDTGVMQRTYGDLVATCINKQLNDSYGLRAYTEIQVCDTNSRAHEIDYLDILFLVMLFTLMCLVIVSSWYDSSMNCKRDICHYKEELDKGTMIWVSFSILRNWYRLTSRSHEALNKQLRFVQAMRFFTMYLVILGHSSMMYAAMPTTNPAASEKMYHNIGTMILTSGVQITQTFLAISGTLLAIQFMEYAQKQKNISYLYIIKASLYRYMRLTPVYAFVILLHASWLIKLQDGPFWRLGTETERTFCHRNWWTNLLYINNYVHADQPCVQPTWYLGVDFQLCIVGLILLITIVKFPRYKVALFACMVTCSYVVPALFVYFQELEGTFAVTLESQRFCFWFDKSYLKAYLPTHMNFGNYLAGIVTGLIFLELQKRKINLADRSSFRISWYSCFLVVPLLFLPNYMFYVNKYPTPSLWMAIYYAFMKNTWGIAFCIVLLGFIQGVSPQIKRMFNHRLFEPLGRMTYGAYLSHAFVIRCLILYIRAPIHVNTFGMFLVITATVVFSYSAALFLCLLIEFPVSALQKQIFGSFRQREGN